MQYRLVWRALLVIANNSAIKGGTISTSGLKKSLRLQQMRRCKTNCRWSPWRKAVVQL